MVMGMKSPIALTVVALVLGASLVGCGKDKPAVCGSVDDLKTSVANLKDIDITSSSAVSDLESGLSTIKTDLGQVKTDAKSEFSSQIGAAEASYTAAKSSVDAAKADPSAATLAAAGSALSAFNTAVRTLISDIQSTC
jgi:hypothetical protein